MDIGILLGTEGLGWRFGLGFFGNIPKLYSNIRSQVFWWHGQEVNSRFLTGPSALFGMTTNPRESPFPLAN
jgi:hypothetical protein